MVWLRSISGHFYLLLLYSLFGPPTPPPHIVLLIPLDTGEVMQEWSLALKQKGQSLEGPGQRLGPRLAHGTAGLRLRLELGLKLKPSRAWTEVGLLEVGLAEHLFQS